MQSSGFLDLKSLMALGQTCKAHALDEQSLILLIEHEATRYHGVETMDEVIEFWRKIYRGRPLLKRWLERDYSSSSNSNRTNSTAESMQVTRNMVSDALPYEVMFVKMLRTVPTESERLQLVSERDSLGMTLLHRAAWTNRIECIKVILALYPDEAERLQAVKGRDTFRWTVLHYAASSGNPDLIQLILVLYPESERLQSLNMKNNDDWTVLHCVAHSGDLVCIKIILSLYPESELLQAVNTQNRRGGTVLHCVAESNKVDSIRALVSLYPEPERFQALNMTNRNGDTVLDHMKPRNSIMEWLSQADNNSSRKRSHDSTLQTTDQVDVEQPETKLQKSVSQ